MSPGVYIEEHLRQLARVVAVCIWSHMCYPSPRGPGTLAKCYLGAAAVVVVAAAVVAVVGVTIVTHENFGFRKNSDFWIF